jgi:hypothetical protein
MVEMAQGQLRFAWLPTWVHREQPAWGFGRLVWLRWIACRAEYRPPAYSIERDLACQMFIIRIAASIVAAALLALVELLVTGWRW